MLLSNYGPNFCSGAGSMAMWLALAPFAMIHSASQPGQQQLSAGLPAVPLDNKAGRELAENIANDTASCIFKCNFTQDPLSGQTSSVATACPGVAAKDSALDTSTLAIPAGVHVLFYGQSYLHEHFYAIHMANRQSIKSSEYISATSKCGQVVRHTLTSGSTLTAVINHEPLSRQGNASALREFVHQGPMVGVNYSHAFVMEPHVDDYFKDINVRDEEEIYGCGWSTQFWSIWNDVLPGKVRHVTPWGYESTHLAQTLCPTAPGPVFELEQSYREMHCSAEAYFYPQNGNRTHYCMIAQDSSGIYLGPIAYMAADLLVGFVRNVPVVSGSGASGVV